MKQKDWKRNKNEKIAKRNEKQKVEKETKD